MSKFNNKIFEKQISLLTFKTLILWMTNNGTIG